MTLSQLLNHYRPADPDVIDALAVRLEVMLLAYRDEVTIPRARAAEMERQARDGLDRIIGPKTSHGRVVDLFAGAGGLSLGFAQAGFEVVASFELDKAATETLAANFTHPVECHDLNDRDAIQRVAAYRPDVIVGGPPCQEFSTAGNREEGPRAALTTRFAEIVSAVKPRAFLMENVAQAKASKAWSKGRAMLKRAGYGLTECVIDASNYGVPQRRRRFVVVGLMGGKDGGGGNQIADMASPDRLTVAQALGDWAPAHFYQRARHGLNRSIFSAAEPAPTIRVTNRPVPADYEARPGDTADAADVSRLTSDLRAAIQTFPRDFRFMGSTADVDRQIGNAVPPAMARKLAGVLAQTMPANDDRAQALDDHRRLEVFRTPMRAVTPLLDYQPEWFKGRGFDPSAGDGRMIAELIRRGEAGPHHLGDIRPDEWPRLARLGEVTIGDYLAQNDPPAADFMITNPPFSLTDQFIAKARTHVRGPIVILQQSAWAGSAKRAQRLKDAGLAYVLNLKRRPRWEMDNGAEPPGRYYGFSWFVFLPDHEGPPVMDWLDDPEMLTRAA